MSSSSIPDKPSRRTVETLFREILNDHYSDRLHQERVKADEALRDFEDQLQRGSKKYQALRRKRETTYKRWRDHRTEVQERTKTVQRKYLANGLTEEVKKDIDKLVKWINRQC